MGRLFGTSRSDTYGHDGTDDDGHAPDCTGCEHECVRARRTPNPTRMIALGAQMCRFCDDHAEAVDAGY